MVPLLITMDLEIASDRDFEQQAHCIERLQRDFQGLPMTVFCTGNAASLFASELATLGASGHEIGCHGLTHAPDENFRTMRPQRIREVIGEATERIQAASGKRPRYFRGPAMTTSAATQAVLVENSYVADFSVCPGRLDIATCRGGTFAWLGAPRVPYRPAYNSPFRRGQQPLLVVPLSALGLPLISGVLYTFGLRATRFLFHSLLNQARRTPGQVLVYLFHSYEFVDVRPGRTDARPLRQRLYRRHAQTRYDLHRRHVDEMLAAPDVVATLPSSMGQYLETVAVHEDLAV